MSQLYLVAPLILIVIVVVAALLERWSVPVILIAMGAGILFGSDVLRFWDFSDVALTNQIANVALIFILFQGGFSTRREDLRSVALLAGGLATWGVVLTAVGTSGILWGLLGWPVEKALLLAVIVSSTDAAATFSILRRQALPRRVSAAVQIESAANDPMAILLTLVAIEGLRAGHPQWYVIAAVFLWKFSAGILIGALAAYAALWLLNRLRPQDRGHYYLLSLGVILLTYGLAQEARASGMLAVFTAGYVMGNRPFVHKQGVTNFASALSVLAETGMFALMGLLVSPRQWSALWLDAVVLFAVLTLAARPLAIALGTVGMRLGVRPRVFIAWAGLRGAVPIILATYPMTAGIAVGQDVFNIVFCAVILSVFVQGSTLGVVGRWLGLTTAARPQPLYNLELVTMAHSDLDLIVVDLPGPQGAPGPLISKLALPAGSVITLITRGEQVVVPKGSTRLEGWDQVTVLAHAKDEQAVRMALLGQMSLGNETMGGAKAEGEPT